MKHVQYVFFIHSTFGFGMVWCVFLAQIKKLLSMWNFCHKTVV